MTLNITERNEIVKYRLERANRTLREAIGSAEQCFWHTTANRLYYACFYAVSALLIKNGYTAHTHNGTFSMFGKHFVSAGLINVEQNKFYRRVLELRQIGDYDDFVEYSADDILPIIEPAKIFIATIENLIKS